MQEDDLGADGKSRSSGSQYFSQVVSLTILYSVRVSHVIKLLIICYTFVSLVYIHRPRNVLITMHLKGNDVM